VTPTGSSWPRISTPKRSRRGSTLRLGVVSPEYSRQEPRGAGDGFELGVGSTGHTGVTKMSDQPAFWFSAKRYGFGWGLPARWQGWVVLAVYFGLLFGGIYYFHAQRNGPALLGYAVLVTLALLAIVLVTGERPVSWRWGGK
jgi:hypothetical protein